MLKRHYIRFIQVALLLCCITGNKVATAQSKKEVLETGFYQTVAYSSYRVKVPETTDSIYIDTVALCLSSDFREVRHVVEEYGHQPAIQIRLTEAATKRFAEASKRNIGKRIAIIAGGRVLTAPVVQSEIPGGELTLTGGFTLEETRAIAERMQRELPENIDARITQVSEACSDLDEAMMQEDTAKLGLLLHDQLVFGHSNGLLETKATLFQHLREGYLKYDRIYARDLESVRFVEHTAQVKRGLYVTGSVRGYVFAIQLRVLEIWTQQDGRWKLWLRQSIKRKD